MGSSKSQTVGYRYSFGLHMGLARGPVDELIEITVGDRTAWSGSVTASSTIDINAPTLFGGDKGEGGIVGPLDVMMGEPAQAVNSGLAAMLGGLVPAFRGVATLFFNGQVCALNPYPKPWKFRVRRAVQGWDGPAWYPDKAVISLAGDTIKAMNPAHIVYECLTNRDWGRGLPAASLDAGAFTAAADTLYTEGLGLCLRWARQDGIAAFVGQVIDHVGATLFVDRVTGLLTLRLIRQDYDPLTLPLFTPDTGLLGIDDDDNGATAVGINQQIVGWHDPVKNEPHQVRVQNLALIQSLGAVASQTTDYPGLPTAELALRIAQRDLVAGSAGLKRFKVRLDRRGYQIQPGGVFRISDPGRGVSNMVLRAGRIEDGTLAAGAITVTALQDVFGLAATSYVSNQPPTWVPPNNTPTAVATRRLMEIPYRDLAATLGAADLDALDPLAGYLAAWGLEPSPLSLNFTLKTRVGVAAFVDQGPGNFAPTGLLVGAMAIGADPVAVTLSSAVDLDQVALGTAALIDDEILRIDAVDAGAGTATLARGCADTVPASHAVGARVWFYDGWPAYDPTEYSSGTAVDARLITHTSTGDLDPVLAAIDTLTMAQRLYRPYPPGLFKINGVAYPTATQVGALVIDWAHRDRLLQADQLIDAAATTIGPEAGTTYTAEIRRQADNVLIVAHTGVAGETTTFTALEIAEDGALYLLVWSVRGGLDSQQQHRWDFDYTQV